MNVAWIMASNGMRVLVVDWDLEAPGLNRYLIPFLNDPELTATRGLLDLLIDFQLDAMTPNQDASKDWYNECASVKKYVTRIAWSFPSDGSLDLLGAGQQGPTYVKNLVSFDWTAFYERFGGGAFLNILKERMKSEYDYVLIDSRTGINDIAGICTVQMPDDLVICITLNSRSIEGGAAIASSVMQQRELLNRPLRIFPIPVHVDERAEFELGQHVLESAKRSFSHVMSHLRDEDTYWSCVSVPYMPYFAFDELPAAFAGEDHSRALLMPAARLTAYLTGQNLRHELGIPEDERRAILEVFKQRRSPRRNH
jgi:cellulose biosynthesis protein BcsQ